MFVGQPGPVHLAGIARGHDGERMDEFEQRRVHSGQQPPHGVVRVLGVVDTPRLVQSFDRGLPTCRGAVGLLRQERDAVALRAPTAPVIRTDGQSPDPVVVDPRPGPHVRLDIYIRSGKPRHPWPSTLH